jgi:uncharacterized protein with HEPN domain
MPRSVSLYLEDILKATEYILRATNRLTKEEFFAHPDIPFAVERNFTIIGEALAQMRQHHPLVFAQIPDAPLIVGFRNILIHGYASIDPLAVWSAVQSDVEPLRNSVAELHSQTDI